MKKQIEFLSTGLPKLDEAIGGGYPRGRTTEIYGHPSSGKTALAILAIAHTQKKDGVCYLVDAENCFNFGYAEKLGVDVEKLKVISNEFFYGEELLAEVGALIEKNKADLIVVDSLAAVIPKAQIEGELAAQGFSHKARLLGNFFGKYNFALSKSKTALVLINQLRLVNMQYGVQDSPGGEALKFYSSVRLRTFKTDYQVKAGERIIGRKIRIKVVKNKVGAPDAVVEANVLFASGFDANMDLLDEAVLRGIITKQGHSYFLQETKLGVGIEKSRQFLADNPAIGEEIKKKL